MKFNPKIHRRRSIRLKEYDYSQNGAYFVTICCQEKQCLFGKIRAGKMMLNEAGRIAEQCWKEIPSHYPNVVLDAFVIMPNHIHSILIIENKNSEMENVGAPLVGAQKPQTGRPQGIAPTIGDIIGAFKSFTTNEYIRGVKSNKFPPFEKRIWQRNYYEHIIRDEFSLSEIREYIIHNPLKWREDVFFVPQFSQKGTKFCAPTYLCSLK